MVSQTLPCGKTIIFDQDVLDDRIQYVQAVQLKLKSGEIDCATATKLINEYGKKNKHWRK